MHGPLVGNAGRLKFQRVLACVLLLVSTSAVAAGKNALYKCVNATGVTSIQSEACPPGSTQAWRRDAVREPAPTPEQAAQAEAKRLRDQQTVRELSEIVEKKLQPVPPAPAAPAAAATVAEAREAAAVDACQSAQAFAGTLREKDWLALSEEQIRRVYGWVVEQCKEPGKSN